MKKLENKCMLITYSDSMGSNLKDLNNVLDKHFKDAIGGVHILPFFSFFRVTEASPLWIIIR